MVHKSYTGLLTGKWFPLCVSAVAFILFVFGVALPSSQEVTHGYVGYYLANRLWMTGQWDVKAYDDRWFSARVSELTDGKIEEIITPNFPSAAYLLFPLGKFSPETARSIWIWENVGFLLLGLAYLLGNRASPLQAWHGYFFGFSLLFFPVVINFNYGQAMVMVLFFLSIASYGFVYNRPKLAGIVLGVIFALKGYGAVLWLIPLFRRDWKMLGWAMGTFAAISVSTLPWAGLDSWLAMLGSMREIAAAPRLGVTSYQSIPGFISHFFLANAQWNPTPLWNSPMTVAIAPGLISVLALGSTLWNTRKTSLRLIIAAILPLNILLIPNALEHHYVLFLIPIFFLLEDLLEHPPNYGFRALEWWLLIAGILCIGLPWPYKHALFSQGWLSFLAYPRLYGGWLIWGAAILRARSEIKRLSGVCRG